MDGEETHVRIVPLIKPRDQLRVKVLLPDIIVEGLVRVDGAANKPVCLDYGAVIKLYAFCLAPFDNNPFDHATAYYPAAVLGNVLSHQVGDVVGPPAGKTEVPTAINHEGHQISETLKVVIEPPHRREVEE